MKYLLWLVLLIAAWWFFRRDRRPVPERTEAPAARPSEAMLACPSCGVHFPASEGVVDSGQTYCCEAHVPRASRAAP